MKNELHDKSRTCVPDGLIPRKGEESSISAEEGISFYLYFSNAKADIRNAHRLINKNRTSILNRNNHYNNVWSYKNLALKIIHFII